MKFSLKVAFMLTAIIVMMATTLSGSVYAGATGKTLSTNYTLVNFGSSDAAVTASYMKSDGSSWTADDANTTFTIPANFGISVIRQYFDQTLSAGSGSVVISSSQPLGAVVQIQARNQTPSQGSYSGYTDGSNKFYVPLAARNRMTASGLANSQIIIQNVDSFAFGVTIDLYEGATKTYTKDSVVTLAPGQSYYYDLADESATNLFDGWIGSAIVTGKDSGKVAVVSNFFTGDDAMQTFNAFPANSIGPKWVVPLFFSRLPNTLNSVIAVQNLSGAAIPADGVALNCSVTNVNDNTTSTFTVKNPAEIADNASYSFNPATDKVLFPTEALKGSCVLDAGTANVVAIVQLRYVGGVVKSAAAYEAISTTAASGKTLIFPLVAKRLGNKFATTVAIQNMDLAAGGQSASVTLTYTPSFSTAECPLSACDINNDGKLDASDKIVVGPLVIPPAGSIQRNFRITSGADVEDTLPELWQGSLVVTSTTSNINGFAQLTYYVDPGGDTFMAHNAFVRP